MAEQQAPQEHPENEALRRLRVLEERFVNLRRKAQLADGKLLASEQKLHQELKDFNTDLAGVRRQIVDMQDSMQAVQAELSHAASVYDLKALQRYVELWNPASFVTKEELIKRNLLKQQSEKSSHAR